MSDSLTRQQYEQRPAKAKEAYHLKLRVLMNGIHLSLKPPDLLTSDIQSRNGCLEAIWLEDNETH